MSRQEHRQELPTSGNPVAVAKAFDNGHPDWRKALRTRIVEFGIRAIWGKSAFPVTMAAGIPLISSGLRLAWLKALGLVGVQRFVATSGLGYKYVCHIGDLAQFPFCHRRAFQNELAICATWLHQEAKPVVFDVGANVGFFCTHLAQMVASQAVEIYAFEPVNRTFVKLVQSVEDLGLADCIHTVAAAVLDEPQPVRLQYSLGNSLLAQITPHRPDPRAGKVLVHAAGTTLDAFSKSADVLPTLLKIDVEGYEVAVLRGAQGLLSRLDRPALAFEYYPDALQRCCVGPESFYELLSGYALYYVDDFEGQKMSFGCPIARLEEIKWGCNLFAVPLVEGASARWASALKSAQRILSEHKWRFSDYFAGC
jgi:FkbM family methyltransferase